MASICAPGSLAFLTALSIFSAGIFTFLAFSIAARRPGDSFPPESLASTEIKRTNLEKILLFLESVIAFLCFICAHLLCPDIYLIHLTLTLSLLRRGGNH